MVRYNCVRMTLKSNCLDLCVARRPSTGGNVRSVNATVLYVRLIRTATRVKGRFNILPYQIYGVVL